MSNSETALTKGKVACFQPLLSLVLAICAGRLLLALPASADSKLVKSYDVESSVYKECTQAEGLLTTGAYAQARDTLLPAVSYDPTSYSASVHTLLSKANRGLKDYQKAIAEAQSALKFNPDNQDALYTIALTYNDVNQHAQAIKYLERAVANSNDEGFKTRANALISDINAYKDLKEASIDIDHGRDSDAKRLLDRAATHDPSKVSGLIHTNLAYVMRKLGKPEKAISEGEKALQYDPTSANALYTTGIAYQDIGKFDEAISWLQRYVAVETDDDRRKKANEFIQELVDDKSKQNSGANSKADYLEQAQANNEVNKWPRSQLPVKFYIVPGTDVYGYRPVFRTFVLRSLDSWFNASDKKISYLIVDDPKLADVKVKFTPNEITVHESSRTRQKAGLTKLESNEDKLHGVVRIRTVCGFDSKRLIQDGQCATICMHEIGHALGLGHSTSVSDVMYFGSSSKQPGMPSARDKATIRRLYGDYPQAAVAVDSKPGQTSQPVDYLPPPMFLPPKPVDSNKLVPPLFLPPPLKTEKEKLQPPLFVPPPISASSSSKGSRESSQAHELSPPLFTPPPIKKATGGTNKPGDGKAAPPLFMPPPPK